MYKVYEVQNGETINSIANKLGVTTEVITSLNGLNQNAILTPGTYIIIPGEEETFGTYTVKPGDNIYSIAKKYNIKENQLLKLNGLNENEYIYPNQQIFVPKDGITFYITEMEDTLNKVSKTLSATPNELNVQNQTIYLVPDQLIVYKQ